jgi:hypothetical protein
MKKTFKVYKDADGNFKRHEARRNNQRGDYSFSDKQTRRYSEFQTHFEISKERIDNIKKIRDLIDDFPIFEKCVKRISLDAAGQEFRIISQQKRAEKFANKFVKDIDYINRRSDFIANALFFGDMFLELVVDTTMRTGYNISDLIMLPPETMHRNVDEKGIFKSQDKAFFQAVDFYDEGNRVYFPSWKIVHARNDRYTNKFPIYGRPLVRSSYTVARMLLMQITDMVMGRHTSAGKRTAFIAPEKFASPNPGQSPAEYMRECIEGTDDNPIVEDVQTNYYLPYGSDVTMLDPKNQQLSNVDDILLLLAVVSVGLEYPFMKLLGGMFPGLSTSGPAMQYADKIVDRLLRDISIFEKTEIIKPILNFEFKANMFNEPKYEIEFPRPNVEDEDTLSRRLTTEVAAGRMSRETAWKMSGMDRIRTWDEEWRSILTEELMLSSAKGAGSNNERQVGETEPGSGNKGQDDDSSNPPKQNRFTPFNIEDVLRKPMDGDNGRGSTFKRNK